MSSFREAPTLPSKILEEIDAKIASGAAGKILQDYTNGELKLSMWIPSDLAGRVIGKKGTVITNLQRETKTRLINALPRVGDSLWIAVVIIGELKNVFDACKAITEIVENEVDDVVLEFTINYRKPFFLYGGRKFGILKKISADTSVRIFFPEFNPKTQAFKDAQPVSLEGNSDNVKRAVSMFEKEALIYQHVMAIRSERDRQADAASIGSRESDSKEAKPARRAAAAAPVVTATSTTAHAAHPSTSGPSAPTAASTEEVSAGGAAGAKGGKSRLVDATGIERILSAREPKPTKPTASTSAPSAAHAFATNSTPIEKAVALGAAEAAVAVAELPMEENPEDEGKSEPAVPRAPVVKLEKIINIPTTLVGLLLSKRPKAKNTTINVIQLMTHTIISKLPPAGIQLGSGADVDAAKAEGDEQTAEAALVVDGDAVKETVDGADTLQKGDKAAEATRRRRAVSDEDGGEAGSGDGSSDTEGDGSDDSIGGSDSASDDDLEQESDEGEFVDAATDPAASTAPAFTAEAAGEAAEVPADEQAEGTDGAAAEAVSGAAAGSLEDRKNLKKLMIAESEKLGFVSFRVVGYYQENVDMVVEALENIIKGDRIMEVTEKLRTDARSLKWPPKDALREKRPLAERKERFDKTGVPRERPERAERVDGERPSKFKSRDPDRVKAPRPIKRRDYGTTEDGPAAEGAGAAGEGVGGAAEGTERVSRYKGKKPFREVDPADPSASGPPKRVPRGPPKLGEDGKPRPPRGSKFAPKGAASGEAAPSST